MPKLAAQRGITAISILLAILLSGIAVLLLLKVSPVYIEWYSVNNAFRSLKEDLELRAKSPTEIQTLLKKRFDLNDIHSVNLREDVKIKKTGSSLLIELKYEVVTPLFSNISLLFDFEKSWTFE